MRWDLEISRWLNFLTFGDKNEPLCSRVYRNSLFSRKWEVARKVLDRIMFEKDHCFRSRVGHLRRRRRAH